MENRKECYEVGALLYCPALNEGLSESIISEKFGKKYSIAICLEDTVAEEFVPQAEQQLHATLLKIKNAKNDFYHPKIFIRVRDPEQLDRVHDMVSDCWDVITGYIFPKYTISNTVKYNDLIDGNYLYNRCHLIAYELAGENANEMNLITGTRYMNIQGMLPYENQIADYVKQTGNHVLYRVTPVFKDEELVARGVILEGYSVEDKGDGICFCVYAFNVQPGIQITYLDGNSCISTREEIDICENNSTEEGANQEYTYVLNKNTKKFHYESCSSVQDIKEKNKEIVNATRDDIIDMGYKPCGRCKP